MEIPFRLFDDMTFLGKVGDIAFLVIAWPCVVSYLFWFGDGSGPGSGAAARRSQRYEKAAKTAMKKRKKNEPATSLPIYEEVSVARSLLQVNPTIWKLYSQTATPQHITASRLLGLPLEIRQQIYLEVLGNKTFHIVQLPKRLGHRTCTSSITACTHDNIICNRSCLSSSSPQTYRHGEPLDMTATSNNSLSLLQTSRQIYHETHPILHRTNTFDINHPQTLLFLARTTSPSFLAQIRHLNLTWSGNLPFIEKDPSKSPDDIATWVSCWGIIGKEMTGLRSLKVRMLIYEDEVEKSRSGPFLMHARKRWTTNGVQFEKLLEVMKENVRGLREFRLGVELPEEVVWDVEELEGRLRAIVCSKI